MTAPTKTRTNPASRTGGAALKERPAPRTGQTSAARPGRTAAARTGQGAANPRPAATRSGTATRTRPADRQGVATRTRPADRQSAPPRRAPLRDRQPVLWFVGSSPSRAPRTPFVLLILGILGCGLVALLLLNTATASDSFRADSLQQQNNALTLRQQALQRDVSALEAPQALAKSAAALGMVPGPDPAFLVVGKDGSSKVVGNPSPSATAVVPPPPAPTPSPTPSAHPSQAQHKAKPTHTAKPTHKPSSAKPSKKASQKPTPRSTPTPTGTHRSHSSRHAAPPASASSPVPTTGAPPTGDHR